MIENKAKIKVLYVITKANWGGAQRYVFDLATNLPKESFDVAVALGGEGILKAKLESSGVRIIPIAGMQRDISFINDLHSFSSLLTIFKENKPDIVHLNSSKAGGIGSVAARIAGVKKIIFTIHGWPFNEDRGLIATWAFRMSSWMSSLFSTHLIVLATPELEQARSMPFIGKKTHLIRNGLIGGEFLSNSEARKKLWPENPSGTWVGTIAELHQNKGLSYLVETAALLPSLSFCIIGEGEKRKELESLIEKYGLRNIRLAGFQDNATQYLKAFDIFVLPSIKEGLPYAILEAGRAGLPTVATAVGGIQDIITDGLSGFIVSPKSSRALAEAIGTLSQNKELMRKFARNLEKKVVSEFDFTTITLPKTLAVYNS